MRTQFLKSDVITALSKYGRVAEGEIVIAEGLPEVIAHTDNVGCPSRTGRLRGGKNKREFPQEKLPLNIPE